MTIFDFVFYEKAKKKKRTQISQQAAKQAGLFFVLSFLLYTVLSMKGF